MTAPARSLAAVRCLVVWWLAATLLSPGSVAAADTLRIAHYDTGAEGKPVERMLHAALREAGIAFTLVDMPLGRALAETSRGALVDADPFRTLEAAREWPDVVAVPEPVVHVSLRAFIRADDEPVTGWDSLKGRRLATSRGFVVAERVIRQHGYAAYLADTHSGAALMLAFHRVDVALLPGDAANATLQRFGITRIQSSGPALARWPVHVVLHKRHAALAPRLATALRHQKTVFGMK